MGWSICILNNKNNEIDIRNNLYNYFCIGTNLCIGDNLLGNKKSTLNKKNNERERLRLLQAKC